MNFFDTMLENVETVAVIGHVRPDGDCIGSCLAVYNYLEEHYPDVRATVFLEKPSVKFGYLKNVDRICSDFSTEAEFDLCLCLDCSDTLRFGDAVRYLNSAKKSVCVDHHVTNNGFAGNNIIVPGASSTCEVLFGLLEEEKISKSVAECIYTGIIHDTGVFKYDCTSAKTMETAGKMMAKGIDFPHIIDDSFYRKTYIQNQVLGRALLESCTFMEGRCIFSVIYKRDMEFYGAAGSDLDGIIDQLRITEGVECAIFMYETNFREFKVSLRSTGTLDVSRIALHFGGGGHVKAAGCTMSGSVHDVINSLSAQIMKNMSS